MTQKKDDWSNVAHFNIRCALDTRKEVEKAAKEAGQSVAEWIRRAIKNELDRERAHRDSGTGVDDAGALAAALLRALDDPVVAAEVKRRMDKIK